MTSTNTSFLNDDGGINTESAKFAGGLSLCVVNLTLITFHTITEL